VFVNLRPGWAVLLLSNGCWRGSPAPPPVLANHVAPSAVVHVLPSPLAAELGVLDPAGGFVERDQIPLYGGSVFGWRLQLECVAGTTIAVREELRLPAPGAWGADPDMEISHDGLRARVRSQVPCGEGGWIEKIWGVSNGDPEGVWTIRVTAAGYAPHLFHATFVP
jgi:hypothetical protein